MATKISEASPDGPDCRALTIGMSVEPVRRVIQAAPVPSTAMAKPRVCDEVQLEARRRSTPYSKAHQAGLDTSIGNGWVSITGLPTPEITPPIGGFVTPSIEMKHSTVVFEFTPRLVCSASPRNG